MEMEMDRKSKAKAGEVEIRKRRRRGRGVDLYWRVGGDKRKKGGAESFVSYAIILAFPVPWRPFRFGWISWQYSQSPTFKLLLYSRILDAITPIWSVFPYPTWGHGDVSQSREYNFPERRCLIYLTMSQAVPAPHVPLTHQGQCLACYDASLASARHLNPVQVDVTIRQERR